ncbi:auxin-responsive protein SAUR15 [Ricinus communis]|uniref:Calmodulin binding protein, putative n=1 Tax=Ricinus communis TaxID=3988 RepID=B9SWG4_RICCO|nr:auxin-responsive protein SAUR15 [Ricinus communis]EEF32049.1 calmodulin binding protein, putative [Ricinus communis]|eukprot:XP_002530333.1 auxin-responsive protein SAUR15 [Ricinus communis]
MLGKKMVSFKKLAKKVKVIGKGNGCEASQQECLLGGYEDESCLSTSTTPTGFFALYVGEERERFVVPTSFLNHPLFKMLLEKSFDELNGFEQKNRLVVPCSVSTFQEVVNAIGCCNGRFDFGDLVEEFI